MSVIIEALKKLNSETEAAKVPTEKLRPRNERPAGRLSPAHALLCALILLVLVSALLSGLTYLTRRKGSTNAPASFSIEKKNEKRTEVPPEAAEKKASTDSEEALVKAAVLKTPPIFQPKLSGDPETTRNNDSPIHRQGTAEARTTPAPEKKRASNNLQSPRRVPDHTDLPDAPLSAPPYITEGERLFLANREKSLKVEKLVHRIEKAVAGHDPDLVPPLLEKLTELKGEEDAYVLKLKAFWLIRQNNYPAGARHLEKVLKKNRDDLEAGINMAVIEIHTHQLEKALARLTGLKKRHPDNPLVQNLMLKVKQAL